MTEWLDDSTLPSRIKHGARKTVREILICYLIATVAGAIGGLYTQESGSGAESLASMLLMSAIFIGWLGIPLWGVYRVIRFAVGR